MSTISIRLFDLLVSGVGLVILSPLFLLLAIAIKLYSRGPVFYRALRVGKDGCLFRLYKFRSMVVDADKQGPGITIGGDSRITSIGRFLRHTKLDELPQLINVLKGEMGLVGPRPEDPRYAALYTPEQRRVLRIRPGITSAASLAYRYEEQLLNNITDWETVYCAKILPSKLAIDLDYLARRSFWRDIDLILRTIVVMFQ
jgi:lipopolysaccharide/colanic/teichoic acid biosynthesis glycosyltransferase